MVGILKTLIGFLHDVIEAVKGVINWIGQMVDIARNAVATVQNAIDAVNPFAVTGGGGVPLPVAGISGLTSRAMGDVGVGGGGGRGNITVNIHGGDPWRIERAVQNGFRNWTGKGGRNAPTREW
jgi:hypothetical protein